MERVMITPLPNTSLHQPDTETPFQPFSSQVRIDVSAQTDTGLLRANNEDQFYIARMSRALETMATSLPSVDVPQRAEEVNYAMVVADGMGGHAAGEVASRLAITKLVDLALELPNWILKVDDKAAPELELRARQTLKEIGSVLFREGRQNPALYGMGSTMTIARSLGRDLMIVHVGDSRAYLLRSGRLHRLTKDHTYAQMMVDCGKLEACDIADSGVRHILTNALGGSTENVDVDVDRLRLEDGDRLLLCSDGLSDLVDDEAMTRTLLGAPLSSDACAQLVKMALDSGGRDNVTVIVASYTFPEQS
jgi:PPM family protein phosphatase